MKTLLSLGHGYSAQALATLLVPQGWHIIGTTRSAASCQRLKDSGVEPLVWPGNPLGPALARATHLLVSIAPDAAGDPVLANYGSQIAAANLNWVGYLSTTGVYGDRRGGWVTETSRLAAQSLEGARRVGAERDWLEVGRGMGLTVTVHRLPGIYGPGRSAFERLREGRARRITTPGQVFSRIHVDDLAAGLEASIARPRAGGIYNLCDDEPVANSTVIAHAAGLIGLPAPPEEVLNLDALSPQARRFYAETKRVSNARAKAELGWKPAYPTYREGLAAILATES